MKIVVDTNVVASAIFFGGKPRILVEKLMQKEVDAYVTKEIIDEYSDTVSYLFSKYPSKEIRNPLAYIVSACHLIEGVSDVEICRDPDDNKFINCAIDARAMYIVSGDKDLLVLQQYEDIEIVTVGEFLNRIDERPL